MNMAISVYVDQEPDAVPDAETRAQTIQATLAILDALWFGYDEADRTATSSPGPDAVPE
ncbi:hypothetical protein LJR030_001159 [Rhizobium sp. LjRoot30]|uniref:hypothetical protein n=1 Tax=Rhizobium sp. LjRoot30 TaxID=3342320 RepID=UPI003ECD0721